jgi:hypothetical protein
MVVDTSDGDEGDLDWDVALSSLFLLISSCEVPCDAEREVAMKMLLPVFYCGTVGLAGSYFPHRNFLFSYSRSFPFKLSTGTDIYKSIHTSSEYSNYDEKGS